MLCSLLGSPTFLPKYLMTFSSFDLSSLSCFLFNLALEIQGLLGSSMIFSASLYFPMMDLMSSHLLSSWREHFLSYILYFLGGLFMKKAVPSLVFF